MRRFIISISNCLLSLLKGMFIPAVIVLAGCEKEPVASAAADARVQTIPLNDTLSRIITENVLLTSSHTWYIAGWVYVSNEATLHIEPGTVIKIIPQPARNGNGSGGGLVITRGAGILAAGLNNLPICFQLTDTTAACSGGWAGIILLGRAPAGAGKQLENEQLSSLNASTGLAYGGRYPQDSSGVLRHVHIQGIRCNNNKNKLPAGLLLLGAGSRTVVEDVIIQPLGEKPYYLNRRRLP